MEEKSALQIIPRPQPPPGETSPLLPQVVNIGGHLYSIAPVGAQQPERRGIMDSPAFIVGTSLLLGFSVGAVIVLATRSAAGPAPTPVVVEKPVPVPQTIKPNCLIFCGNN